MVLRKPLSIVFIILILFHSNIGLALELLPSNARTLRIAGDNNYPPYEYIDSNGNYKGFNLDIMRAIAIELGLDIELVPTSWENAISTLVNGQVDAIQGMTISPERDVLFDFSDEIVLNSQSIFVLTDTSYISDLGDLKGKKVSVQDDDITSELLKSYPAIEVIERVNQYESLKLLLDGEVDAFIGNRLTGIYNVQRYNLTESIKIVGEPISTTPYSVAVRNGNEDLIKLFNKGLAEIKENGTYNKIYSKWFGETIVDINQQWRSLIYILLTVMLIIMVGLLIIYLINKRLKKEVAQRTQEIEELYKLAKHNDKMQALGVLSAGLAHELRNPLTSIKTFIDLIPLKIRDDNFRAELINIVPKELKRLDELVGSLLDYSKPRGARPEMVNLDEVITEIVTMFKKNLKEKNINLVRKNTDINLYVDNSQLKQILINIVLNSVDAIEEEGIIEISGTEEDRKSIILIKDNGKGIKEENLEKLFDPFYSSKDSGYGIGLSITDRLIRENRGSIKIESELGKGSSVIIKLPNGN